MNELDFLRKVWGENTETSSFPNKVLADNLADNLADEKKQKFSNTDNADIIKKLKKLEFLQKRVNIMKVVAITLLLTSFVFTVNKLNEITPAVYIGISVIILSTITFMAYYFKNQFSSSKLDYTLTSAQFAKKAVEELKNQNKIFGLPFMLFILAMIVGVNIVFLGMTTESGAEETLNPLYFHIVFSLLVALGGFIGMQVRKWRIKREVTPLIEALQGSFLQ